MIQTMDKPNRCINCNRQFRFKDLYDQHAITCDFLFKSRKEKDRETDAFERLPTSQEQFKLIQNLYLQISKLEKEVDSMRGQVIIRKRKEIIDFLQSKSNPIPQMTFLEWSKTIIVSKEMLETVFSKTLNEGIRMCISVFVSIESPPIRAFSQKKGTIYVYERVNNEGELEKSSWRVLSSDEFDRWIDRIMHKFLQVFVAWQLENMKRLNSNEEQKDKNLEYMQKINGNGQTDDRRKNELRKWFYETFKKEHTIS
jgi:hypothetical protein